MPRGELERAAAGRLTYDFTAATVGDVRLDPDSAAGFGAYHFDRTRFDDFDFSAYHGVLDRTGWRLTPATGEEALASPAAEETYLKAKNGAKRVGDATAAAEFFRKELAYLRRNHARRARAATAPAGRRLRAGGRWAANGLLAVTTGYGERPWRVVACSVGIVALFVGVYAAAFPAPPHGTPLGYLVFSVESFVALVLGGAPAIEGPLIRLIAQVEGFLGAFFIALFVVTLTRSIQR